MKPIVDFSWKGVDYVAGKEYDNIWYMDTGNTRTHGGWRRYEKAWGIFVGTWPTSDPENGAVISDIPYNVGHPIIDADRAFARAMKAMESDIEEVEFALVPESIESIKRFFKGCEMRARNL
jgi:hypothetical protein